MFKVLIENSYSDGHESSRTVELPDPNGRLSLDEWWEDVVWPETGDGHGIDNDIASVYTATITEAPEHADLVGLTREWA